MTPTIKRKDALHGSPLHPNAAIQQEYAKAIMTLVRRMHDDVRREMQRVFNESQFAAAAMDDDRSDMTGGTVASQARIALAALLAKYTTLFNRLARRSTKRMIDRTLKNSAVTLGLSLKQMAPDVEIKIGGGSGSGGGGKGGGPGASSFGAGRGASGFSGTGMTDRLQEIITASTAEAVSLIKLIPQKYLGDVQGAVMRSITGGGGMKDLVPFLSEKYGQNIRHARMVAMDQTRKSYSNITAHRMRDIGVRQYVWMHVGGSAHPRKLHQEMNGKTYSLDDPPVIDERTGERGIPGTAINCFPGSTKVSLSNGCHKLFRRGYTGELTTLVTDDGVVLESTPNHPILTGRGWLAAKDIQVGDDLFHARQQRRDGCEIENTNHVSRFDDLFDALLSIAGGTRKISGAAGLEFHGDVSDGEIDVIDIDALLPREWDAEFCKRLCEFSLAWADENIHDLAFLGDGSKNQFIVRALGASDRVMRGFGALLALLGAHSSHADEVRGRWASYLAARLNKPSADDDAINTKPFGQFKLAHAGGVEGCYFGAGQLVAAWMRAGRDARNNKTASAERLGEIVWMAPKALGSLLQPAGVAEKRSCVVQKLIRKDFSGHVFNLETEVGWYASNGIITHNCRCVMRPIVSFATEN